MLELRHQATWRCVLGLKINKWQGGWQSKGRFWPGMGA